MIRLFCGAGLVICLFGLLVCSIVFSTPAAQAETAVAATPTATRTPTSTRAPTPTRTPTPTRVPPSPPELLGPEDDAVTTAINYPPLGIPTFTWRPALNGTFYRLEISDNPGFATMLLSIKTSTTSYTPKIVWVDGEYYWRVQTGNGQSFNENSGAFLHRAAICQRLDGCGCTAPPTADAGGGRKTNSVSAR